MAQKNINTKQHWDERWTCTPMLSRKLEKILVGLVDPELSVLDIGCGSGRMLRSLKKDKNCSVFGIDISEVAINQLRRWGISGAVINVEDMNTFAHSGETFHVVLLSHTLEHISNYTGLIFNIAQLCKKYLIVAVPNDCIGPEEEPEHVHQYSKEILIHLLSPYFTKIEDHSRGVHLILKAYA